MKSGAGICLSGGRHKAKEKLPERAAKTYVNKFINMYLASKWALLFIPIIPKFFYSCFKYIQMDL